MWELLFEKNPYINLDCKKIHYFRDPSPEDTVNTIYSIPIRVGKGRRPCIPFQTRLELEIWLSNFSVPTEKQIKKSLLTEIIEQYAQLMKACWSQDPQDRPSFYVIVNVLNNLQQLVKDDQHFYQSIN